MSDLRKRATAGDGKTLDNGKVAQAAKKPSRDTFGVIDALRILGGLVLLNCTISYFVTNNSVTWGYRPWWSKPAELRAWMDGPVDLNDLELSAYDGKDPTKPIYLALNGTIYDVSAGANMYGPGGSYSFFAGRDATRAFITGCFDTDLTPDTRGAEWAYMPVDDDEDTVSKSELKIRRERDLRFARKKAEATIEGWSKMFRGEGGKKYFKVGKVVRKEGWMDRLPKRELCQRAQEGRPKRSG